MLAVGASQALGLAGTVALLVLSGEPASDLASVAWAAAAGASGVIGVGFFYYALSRGTMGVIAPLVALIGAGAPVTIDIFNGDALPMVRLGGIGVALVAVLLISLPGGEQSGDERRRLRLDLAELPLVVVSGLGFAGFFVFIDHATQDGQIWWPLATVRAVGVLLVGTAVVVAGLRLHGPRRDRIGRLMGIDRLRAHSPGALTMLAILALAGIGDLGGNALFVLARADGDFAVAVVLSSLYPVVTTILAAVLLHERLRATQIVGVGLATVSFVLLR